MTMTRADIVKNIKSIASRGAKLDAFIQSTGLAVIQHIGEHGDYSLANEMLAAMPRGSRKLALVEWFITYAKVQVNMDKATAKERPLVFRKDGVTNLAGATETPWFDCKKEQDPNVAFDVKAKLAALLKQVDSKQKAGAKVELGGIDVEALRKMIA